MNAWFVIYWAIMGAGLSDPLKRTLEVLDQVKTGDLTPRIDLNFPRKDEMGRVVAGINAVLDRLSAMVADIKHSIASLSKPALRPKRSPRHSTFPLSPSRLTGAISATNWVCKTAISTCIHS